MRLWGLRGEAVGMLRFCGVERWDVGVERWGCGGLGF